MYWTHAIKSNGAAWGWGINATGQIGNNTVTSYSSPVLVVGSHSFTEISCGNYTNTFVGSTLALKSNGQVWSWGNNEFGQIGNNTVTSYSSPVLVVGNHSFIQIKTSGAHSITLKANGQAWTWGRNTAGELGNNSTTNRSSPVLVVGNHSFCRIATGLVSRHSAALKDGGQMWTWGNNSAGELGDNTTTNKSSPIAVVGGHAFIKLATGYETTYGLKANGEAWAWGRNTAGELGDNTTTARSSPVLVVGNHSFVDIRATNRWTAALKRNGEVWTWGDNITGNLGDGTVTSRSSPVLVIGNHSFIQIGIGRYHCTALKANGEMWGWGYNIAGQLGTNNTTSYSSPVLVVGNHSFRITMNQISEPLITDMDDERFLPDEKNITISGFFFGAVQEGGKVEIGDNAIYSAANKNQLTVNSWSDTSINVDMSLGNLSDGSLWIFVTNNANLVSVGYSVFVSARLPWGIITVGDLSTAVNHSRAMGGTSPDLDGMLLRSINVYVGSTHTSQLRLAAYTGGNLSTGPAGASLLYDFGQTSGTSTNTWLFYESLGDDIIIPKNSPTWCAWKGNDSGFTIHYYSSSPSGSNYQTGQGRWDSASVSSDETVAYPSTWPADGGSFFDFWYSIYLQYMIRAYGYGMRFRAGNSEYLASDVAFDPYANCSVSFWFYNTDVQTGRILGHSDEWEIYMDGDNKIHNDMNWASGPGTLISNRSLNIGSLYHVVMTRASDNSRQIIINGVLDNSDSGGTGSTSSDTLYVSRRQTATGYLDGYLEDIRIYNRVISLAEAQTIYACKGIDNIIPYHRWLLNEGPQGTEASGAGVIKGLGDGASVRINMTPTNGPEYTGSRIRTIRLA